MAAGRPRTPRGQPGTGCGSCTAIGKAILAHLPEEEAHAVIAAVSPLIRNTAATIVDPDPPLQELEAVRSRGYGIHEEENEANVRCVGGWSATRARRRWAR